MNESPQPRPTDPLDAQQDARLPSATQPDPAPERERPTVADVPSEPGATSEPAGRDNIREGRVRGLMGPPHAQGGQGQGG